MRVQPIIILTSVSLVVLPVTVAAREKPIPRSARRSEIQVGPDGKDLEHEE